MQEGSPEVTKLSPLFRMVENLSSISRPDKIGEAC